MNKKEIRKRILSIIYTTLFLIISTYIWSNYRTVQASEYNSYFNNNYLTMEEVGNGVLLENAFPETDESGMMHNGYTFKINNIKGNNIKYKIMFIMDENNTLDNKYIRYTYNINDGNYIEPLNLENDTIILDSINEYGTNTYNIKFWIDEDATNEIMNKSFSLRIGVQAI